MASFLSKFLFFRSSHQETADQHNYISMVSQNNSDYDPNSDSTYSENYRKEECILYEKKLDSRFYQSSDCESEIDLDSDIGSDSDSDSDTLINGADMDDEKTLLSEKEFEVTNNSNSNSSPANLNAKSLSISIKLNDDIENQLFQLTDQSAKTNFFKNCNKNGRNISISNLRSILNSNSNSKPKRKSCSCSRSYSYLLTSEFFQNLALIISIIIFLITTYYYCNPPHINISLSCLIEAFKKNNYEEQMFIIQKLQQVAETSNPSLAY